MTKQLVRTVKSDPEIRTRLRDEFKRLGKSVEEVAQVSGIPKGTLDNILIGRVESMKDIHLALLCKALPELHLTYVLTGDRAIDIGMITDDVRIAYEANGRVLKYLKGQ